MEFGGSRGQSNGHGSNNNNSSISSGTILGWDVWELNNNNNNNNSDSSAMDWTASSSNQGLNAAFYGFGFGNGSTRAGESAVHAPAQSVYGGSGGSHVHPDPHLVCLKLGKRHYFGDHAAAATVIGRGKKGKAGDALCGGVVPTCQVEGCHVALVNAKDYHRRHKVCAAHSKAPMVVVLGLEQRFCQQCSRFHVVSEFDDTKRSCKRRLAGHNERRRKSSHDSITRNSSYLENKLVMLGGGFPCMLTTPSGRAHSLLSSKPEHNTSWGPNSDLSSRSSAALRELIAENRAAILARQLALESKDASWHGSSHHHGSHELAADDFGCAGSNSGQSMFPEPPHVTLDLMQAPGPPAAFGFVPGSRASNHKAKAEEDDCCDLWSAF